MNGNDLDELQLLGWQTPQVNVDKELITVFAGALVVVLTIVVGLVKLFLRNQAEAIKQITLSNEKVGDQLVGAVKDQTRAQLDGANETRLVLTKLNESSIHVQNSLGELVRSSVCQEDELKALNIALREHDLFLKEAVKT